MATIRKTLNLAGGTSSYPESTTTAGYYIIAHAGDRIELTVRNIAHPTQKIGWVSGQTPSWAHFNSVSVGTLSSNVPGPRTYVINSAPATSTYRAMYNFFTLGGSNNFRKVEILFVQPFFINISLDTNPLPPDGSYPAKLDILSSALDSAYSTGERITMSVCKSGTHTVSTDFNTPTKTFISPDDNDTQLVSPRSTSAGKSYDLVLYSEDTSGESLSDRELDRYPFSVQPFPDQTIGRTSPNAVFNVLLSPTEASSGYKLGITGCGAGNIYWLDTASGPSATPFDQIIGSSFGGETGRTYTAGSTRDICVHTGPAPDTDPITKMPSLGRGDRYYVWVTNVPSGGPGSVLGYTTNISYRVARPDYNFTLTPAKTTLSPLETGGVNVTIGGAAGGTGVFLANSSGTAMSNASTSVVTIPEGNLPSPGQSITYYPRVYVDTSTGGAGSGVNTFRTSPNFTISRAALDDTPNGLTFFPINETGVPLGTVRFSSIETVSGLTTGYAAPLTFVTSHPADVTYRKNGGAWTTSSTTVVNGDTLQVRIEYPNTFGTSRSCRFDIGDLVAAGIFGGTTENEDQNPTGLNLGSNVSNANPGQTYTSALSTISDYNVALACDFVGDTGMEYSLNGGAWTTNPFFSIQPPSATIQVRGVAGPAGSGARSATIDIKNGYLVDTWSITPINADSTPDAFSLGSDVTGLVPSSTAFSGTATISGINVSVAASISANDGTSGLAILVNGVTQGTSATISNGDTVQMQVVASASANVTRIVTLTVGGTSDTVNFSTAGGGTGGGSSLPSGTAAYGLEVYNTNGTSVLLSPNSRFSNFVLGGTEPLDPLESVDITGKNFGEPSRTTIIITSSTFAVGGSGSTPAISVIRNGGDSATLQNNFNIPNTISYIGILHG